MPVMLRQKSWSMEALQLSSRSISTLVVEPQKAGSEGLTVLSQSSTP